MKDKKHYIYIITAISILVILVLDTKTAAAGASEGIDVCLKVAIPSLFPFFIVTAYLNTVMLGHTVPGFKSICNKLHIPTGCEYLLPLGLISGYPVGAKLISDLYADQKIGKRTAMILLGYCNNAGPAFIFGIAGAAFAKPTISVILWLIHIASAVLTAFLLPKPHRSKTNIQHTASCSLSQAVKSSINACVSVCGWIVVFKILIAYLDCWFHRFFQTLGGILLIGILELSNGCLTAAKIQDPAMRFIVYSVFLSFGGLCVYLQTRTVTEPLGIGLYIHGKIVQTCVSLIVSLPAALIIFRKTSIYPFTACFIVFVACLIMQATIKHAKKVVEIT